MPTEKRHMYETGTVNVETSNVAVKQDINYYNANPQSATKSVIRFIEDSDRRFSQNQIHSGLTVSNGGSTVDVASGTAKVGGRWININADNIDATGLTGDYNVVIHVSGVSETNTRDPSGGESVNVFLEVSGSWVNSDWKLALGSANITAGTVNSVIDRAKRQINATIIKPYGSATQVSILTGDDPIRREAIRFTADKIYPYNDMESAFDITVNRVSGSTLDISGQTNLVNISGSAISAASYQIGSEILDITEFQNLVGINQPVDTSQDVSFVQITSTQDNSKPPFVVASTGSVINLNADMLDGQHAPSGILVGTTDTQTLSNKTLTSPIINNPVVSGSEWANAIHSHVDDASGGLISHDTIPGVSINDHHNQVHSLDGSDHEGGKYLVTFVATNGTVSVSSTYGYVNLISGGTEIANYMTIAPKTGTIKIYMFLSPGGSSSSIDLIAYYNAVAVGENIGTGFTTSTLDEDFSTGINIIKRIELTSDGGDLSVTKDDIITITLSNTDTSLNMRLYGAEIVYQ